MNASHAKPILKTVGFYALVGPFIGATFCMILLIPTVIESPTTAPQGIAIIYLFGYLLGVIPAALAGMVSGVLIERQHPFLIQLLGTAFAGAAFSAVITGIHQGSIFLAAFGLVSAIICTLLWKRTFQQGAIGLRSAAF